MSIAQISPAPDLRQASTRHHAVDERFAGILAEDFGIDADTILRALDGEPQKAAIAISEWANRTDDPARALLAWARKHHRGRCRRAREISRRPSRRHGEQQDEERRGHHTPRRPSVAPDGLRGVVADPAALDRLASRMGV